MDKFDTLVEATLNENVASFAKNALKKLQKMTFDKMTQFTKMAFEEFMNMIGNDLYDEVVKIINKHFNTDYKSMVEILHAKPRPPKEMNESAVGNWWDDVKDRLYPTLEFYPALTVFLEIDKLIKGTGDANFRIIAFYAVFWMVLVSLHHIKAKKKK